MTPQEQQLLTQLAQRINQTQLQEKDPEAENFLGKELGTNHDALYILAQTVLVQDMALQRANSHVADLEKQNEELQQQLEADEQEIGQLQQAQQQRPQPAKPTSFLGRIFGEPQPAPLAAPPQSQYQPVSQPPQAAPSYQPVQYAPQQPQFVQPQYVPSQPQYVPAAMPMGAPMGMPMGGVPMGSPMMGGPVVMGGQPSFLRSAMQTAAGVAAGSLAFEGIESLVHGAFGGGHPGGYGGGFGGGFGGNERPVEEVVNNYYGDSGEREHEHGGFDEHREGGERFHDAAYDSGDRYEDRGPHMHDTSYETSGEHDRGDDRSYDPGLSDDSAAYDNSVSDVQLDDSGSYDDNSNVQ